MQRLNENCYRFLHKYFYSVIGQNLRSTYHNLHQVFSSIRVKSIILRSIDRRTNNFTPLLVGDIQISIISTSILVTIFKIG